MKIPIIYWPLEFTLRLLSIWPDYFSIFGLILMISGLITVLPFQCWDAMRLLDHPELLMDSLSDIFSEIVLYVKLFIIWRNKRYLTDLLRKISNDLNDKRIADKWIILNYYACRFCKYDYAWYMGASVLYYIQLVQEYLVVPVDQRVMLLKAYYPFDFKSTPVYEIMNIIQIVQGLSMASINAMTESLLIALVLYTCGHIDLLIDQIKMFSDSCNKLSDNIVEENSLPQASIQALLQQHIQVLNLVKNIEFVYTYVSLAQLIFSTLIMCVTGFVIIIALESNNPILLVKFIVFMLALLWQCFAFCFAGQHLLNKSEQIASKIYDTFWYNIEVKEIKAISFIIKRAQSPLKITTGKFCELSIETFTMIIKTSFSFLSVLRASYV